MPEGKTLRESVLIETLLPKDTNPAGHIFGGVVMSLMDKAAAVAAVRYVKKRVVTASAEHINFVSPIQVGEVVKARAKIIYTGRTSIDVEVTVEVENIFEESTRLAASGIFVMVAVNEQGHPLEIPHWEPDTEEGKAKYREAQERRKIRAQKRNGAQ
ncbi:MAG: acyl-CoA thioesterase [Carboxydocellales bacterium]